MTYAVECSGLMKKFKKTMALNSVDLKIEENKIYGLLGRNGAGKTTLLNIITAQLFQTQGTVKIFGEEPYENSNVLNKMCFVKDSPQHMMDFKVRDILKIASDFYIYWDNDFSRNLVNQFSLDTSKKYRTLSKGMQSIVGIIIGLSSRAPITIYDEPYVGLDAAARLLFYDILLKDYSENPRTIILSTHLIDEVSKIFESIIILDKGSVLMTEEVDTLRDKALYISGLKDVVDKIIESRKTIHEETMGNNKIAAVFDNISPNEIKSIQSRGLEIASIPLQKFFVYITSDKDEIRGIL